MQEIILSQTSSSVIPQDDVFPLWEEVSYFLDHVKDTLHLCPPMEGNGYLLYTEEENLYEI